MPLVQRDPGGWMSPKNLPKEGKRISVPVFTAQSEPVAHPTIAPTGEPSMAYSRVALVGLT